MNVSFLQELLNTVAEQSRQLLPRTLRGSEPTADIVDAARALVSVRGEASGVALAQHILEQYRVLSPDARRTFFRFLAQALQPEPARVRQAAEAYVKAPSDAALSRLQEAVESPRAEFFRRLNLAPGATGEIVAMRRDLLRQLEAEPALHAVDADLRRLLDSWFNRGFLVLRRIDWQTPAAILEKIIAYEQVHEMQGWDDLRRRLHPTDRRCFAFFHPSLVDEPVIFVEVALTREIPQTISSVLKERPKSNNEAEPTTAVFYSISNCQEGLKGISFGNFLIKQVVEKLARDKPSLKSFVTLSPVPHFARWVERARADEKAGIVTPADRTALQALNDPRWFSRPGTSNGLEEVMLGLAAHYFLFAKSTDGRPVDPVARFHLGNGARLERINWLGDTSEKGLREAHGLMVNYRYDLKEIERNHEAYANHGTVVASRAVRSLLRSHRKPGQPAESTQLPLPKGVPAAGTASEAESV